MDDAPLAVCHFDVLIDGTSVGFSEVPVWGTCPTVAASVR